MASYNPLEAIRLRSDFREKLLKHSLAANWIQAAVIAGLLGATAWSLLSRPAPVYFAVTEQGGVIEMTALDEPSVSDNAVANLAVDTVTQALTLDFANWRRDLSRVKPNFTKDGWKGFLAAVDQAKLLDVIKNDQMVSFAVPAEAPVIAREGEVGGVYSWVVQVRLMITYQSPSSRNSEQRTAEVHVVRVPEYRRASGIAIQQIIM